MTRVFLIDFWNKEEKVSETIFYLHILSVVLRETEEK
jgi:hypothetical protein